MPKRSRRRRTNAIDTLTAKLQKIARPCASTVVESQDAPGTVYMLLMACPSSSACARCDDARKRLRSWPEPPAPAPFEDRSTSAPPDMEDDL